MSYISEKGEQLIDLIFNQIATESDHSHSNWTEKRDLNIINHIVYLYIFDR
jgi:hypothetical protein